MELNSHTERHKIWAIILAAGESKRMGKPKLLLPFGETTIIETVVGNAMQSKVDEVLVVLGCNAENIAKKIEGTPAKTSVNPDFRDGMLSSIQWGFKSLPEDTRAAIIMLGDQPLIPGSVIDRVIDAYRQTEKSIVLPVYNKRRGHPILIDMKHREEVKRLSPDVGLRVLVHNHTEDILEVAVDAPGILKDIDTAEDYSREIRLSIRGKYDFVRTNSEDFAKRKRQEIDMEE
ncbi:NTP transferase domain-containing protein [Candidatus Poribacteria bacterium]